jgi:hypothetical protein
MLQAARKSSGPIAPVSNGLMKMRRAGRGEVSQGSPCASIAEGRASRHRPMRERRTRTAALRQVLAGMQRVEIRDTAGSGEQVRPGPQQDRVLEWSAPAALGHSRLLVFPDEGATGGGWEARGLAFVLIPCMHHCNSRNLLQGGYRLPKKR